MRYQTIEFDESQANAAVFAADKISALAEDTLMLAGHPLAIVDDVDRTEYTMDIFGQQEREFSSAVSTCETQDEARALLESWRVHHELLLKMDCKASDYIDALHDDAREAESAMQAFAEAWAL